MKRNDLRLRLLVLGLVVAAQFALPAQLGRPLAHTLMFCCASVAVLVGLRRQRPKRWVGWAALAAGLAGYAASSLVWLFEAAGLEAAWTGPAIGLTNLAAQVAFLLAVGAFLIPPRAGRDREALVDAAAIVLSGALVTWQVVSVVVAVHDADGIDTVGAAGMGLLAAGALVLGISQVFRGRRPRPRAIVLLLGAAGLALVGNLAALLVPPPGTPRLTDAAFLLGAGLAGIAALDASMRQLSNPHDQGRRLTPTRLVGLGAALLATPLILVLRTVRTDQEGLWVAAGAMALTLLVLGRIARLVVERERGRAAVAREEQRFRSLLAHAADAIAVTDAHGVITYATPALHGLVGRPIEECVGRLLAELVQPEDRAALQVGLGQLLQGTTTLVSVDLRLTHADGHQRWAEAKISDRLGEPGVDGVVVNLREVTERKALEVDLAYQAFHDPLTGLANRSLVLDRTEHALSRIARGGSPVAVLFLDLDDFKSVNDTLGHAAGDELLVAVADRLRSCLRSGDTPARIGGDEFAVLLQDGTEREAAEDIAGRILETLQLPLSLPGQHMSLAVSASVGVALADESSSAGGLLRAADAAMYQAKNRGKARVAVYRPGLPVTSSAPGQLGTDLRGALESGQLFVLADPVVDPANGMMLAVEAKLAWRHPRLGLLSTEQFADAVAEGSLADAVGRHHLLEACALALRLQDPELRAVPVRVMLSLAHLGSPGVMADVANALRQHGLAPADLALALPSGALTEESGPALEPLHRLAEFGIPLQIADFGLGWSSPAVLSRLPVTAVRLHPALTQDLHLGAAPVRLLRAVLSLAAGLGLEVTASGVTTSDQRTLLASLACPLAQGPLFGLALPPAGLERLLRVRGPG